MTRILAMLALSFLLGEGVASGQPSVAEFEERLVTELLAKVLAAAESQVDPPTIALEVGAEGATPTAGLEAGILDFLDRRGYDVRVRRDSSELPEGVMLLELDVRLAQLTQDEAGRGLLALGSRKIRRKADVVLGARLGVAGSEELLFDGLVEAHTTEWFDVDELDYETPYEILAPPTSSNPAGQAGAAAERTGWGERGIALGLLTGVIILFFSGIS